MPESIQPERVSTTQTVVVVGNGMVAHRFCDRLAELDHDRHWRVVVIGEEARLAYDRVHLSELFAGRSASDLSLADRDWYAERGITVRVDDRVVAVDCDTRSVTAASGARFEWDALVLATGSSPFVPPLAGIDTPGTFVYRTIDDVEAIREWASRARRGAVIGGGLLGLEAAKALLDLGLETHVVEVAPRLMPRQVDGAGGETLRRAIERLGVRVHLGVAPEAIVGSPSVEGLRLAGGATLAVDIVVVSAGIRPRDELARNADIEVGQRGGIVVDAALATNRADVFAIGECALANGQIYGLVAPGYAMADTLASRLCGGAATFTGADLSTKLKLLGVDVASFGDAFADETQSGNAQRVVFEDRRRDVYQKLVLSADGERLLGGILVGDADKYPALLDACRRSVRIPERPHELLFPASTNGGGADTVLDSDDAQICACNAVTRGAICNAIAAGSCATVGEVKKATRAGTGCGGCVPLLATLLGKELERAGKTVDRTLCEHFRYSRQELFEIVKLGRIESFDALLASHGQGAGCEICRPAVASILASQWNDFVLNHTSVQDTNDRFLANIQRGGTYSVIPRIPGGEITPEKLVVIGEVAQRFDLSCKITGGQRIDLLGARVDQLPRIWEALVDAGFESGHAYGKAMRTVKSCVGSTWCRYGVQDSTGLAIRIEERYRGIRAPHKLKSAVSGCIRECAEAQSKDFGVIATERAWNLYVCGNGGSQPRHADLLVSDVDDETLIRLIDRFLVYYLQTANPLERTARWLERMDGGIERLRSVIVDDCLGIGARLERDMDALVAGYACEWREVVRDPERRRQFEERAAAAAPPLPFVRERGQKRPADWPDETPLPPRPAVDENEGAWVRVAFVAEVPRDAGITVDHGGLRIAVFNFATRGEWWASQASCPHRKDDVLGRGLLGSDGDAPKVACPLHKKTFSLENGAGLSDPRYCIRTYAVEIRGDAVMVLLPTLGEIATNRREEIACAPA